MGGNIMSLWGIGQVFYIDRAMFQVLISKALNSRSGAQHILLWPFKHLHEHAATVNHYRSELP